MPPRPRLEVVRFLLAATYNGVGFCSQFFHNVWIDTLDPPFCDGFRKQMVVDEKVVLVEILEFTYGDETHAMANLFFNDTDVLILTFDVTLREQLDLLVKTHAAFLRFMDTKPAPQYCLFPEHHTEELSRNASLRIPQTFTCFPRLPQELQLAVLREALTCPYPVALPMAHISGINLNILKACKLFYEEGSKFFWQENTFIPVKPMTVVADTARVTPVKPRAVTTEEGREFARRLGCKYAELSSKDNEPVVAVVSDLIREHRAAVDKPDSALQGQIANLTARAREERDYRHSPKERIFSLARGFKRRASRIFR
ncbi:hypothetical protein AJ78_02274 [Emergomyces pasteurianus Ep9510]|uniref:Uncharacterized protein n=1 Tax=Emergomyces pasteurianus Ep9510 TaxID=1447872 RepID=A0A1J9PM89_9EURO|nr:hypothetical protein AJ78_02274 [Emergomyces pasteurianus Ep9510]